MRIKKITSGRFLLMLKSVQILLLLFMVFFLGYIASYLTNQQIREYCFNYNLYKARNEALVIFNVSLPE